MTSQVRERLRANSRGKAEPIRIRPEKATEAGVRVKNPSAARVKSRSKWVRTAGRGPKAEMTFRLY